MKYDGEPVKGSPFLVEALAPADPSKVRAYGPGLSEGKVGHTAPFTIETMDAGLLIIHSRCYIKHDGALESTKEL